MVEDLTVRDAMTTAYVGVSESDTIRDVIDVMIDEGADAVVVLRGSEAVGTVTERDLLRATTGTIPTDASIASVMSGPGPSVGADLPLSDAASALSTEDRRQLLVRNGDGVAGVLTSQDVITATASLLPASERDAETLSTSTSDLQTGTRTEPENPEYSSQSVCEACGSLMPGLESVNGQAICADCRGA
ncbi:CBS domain-containing protein [Halalkalicoccus jeotgali]|uniref:Signal transduction protein with CBS domains n=1 Tax=Halalkalicoccus jeotgali (strain DSM 18796 / CECT 7217 / JCM 14584 / KCTC 4019 / B3) TaxID=795797 RepID=D8J345_HALJB|nr:CBS domain-containing protein [Halalkalicoccus jeotgali]ADJ15152.1 putative signal transduction protein with CBS domains [Halalkalicoccus jeotgali B3]ELY35128.1 putative signal transduction protein with CBS domains [Halalkalicoccus jeotgali B3]